MSNLILRALLLATLLACAPARALEQAALAPLGSDDNDARIEVIRTLAASGDAAALPLLQALEEGVVWVAPDGALLIVRDDAAVDAASGQAVDPLPEGAEELALPNRVRRELGGALAGLRLAATDREERLAAARALQGGADEALLPLVEQALQREKDAEIKALLVLVGASIQLTSTDPEKRLKAVKALAESGDPSTKTLLLSLLAKQGDDWAEPDARVREAAKASLKDVEGRLMLAERIAQAFSGVSLGSILLLAALGLAITYGLMGVINMAHGELIMIGAYATYVVQDLFRGHLPDAFDWYPVAAVPAAFAAAALVGAALERSVLRHLYGRPLESLLATWGISLVLIQAVRTLFGAQNVAVENPSWMSGGLALASDVVLPWNRIVIIVFALAVLAAVWLLLQKTRLGLYVRAVTQNRAMAGCVGVHTGRVDTWAFALGSGTAGLAGCALSQVGNVGPDLGQSYIVDSFMVVVLGGVGQLAGAVWAGLGLGVASKLLEGWSGAVIAKIVVLGFIIVFIQARPQGLFALKGRFADS